MSDLIYLLELNNSIHSAQRLGFTNTSQAFAAILGNEPMPQHNDRPKEPGLADTALCSNTDDASQPKLSSRPAVF